MPRFLHRPWQWAVAVGISGVLLLGGLSLLMRGRQVPLIWDYTSPVLPTVFVLQACPDTTPDCLWRDVQRLGPRVRTTTVQTTAQGRCFRIYALFDTGTSSPSNTFCPER